MGSSISTDTAPASSDQTTRALLRCGIVAGPFYLAVGIAQGLLRDGFDFSRHALSHLANGPGGWIQTANLAVTGLLVIAAAVGIERVLRPSPRVFVWFLGAFGVAMIAGAIFPADPMDGFPPGTPEGMPESVSTTGLLHFVSGALGFLALAISCFVAAWVMRRRRANSLAILSLLSGLCVFFGFFGGMALPVGIYGIWFAVVMGWVWLAAMSLGVDRQG